MVGKRRSMVFWLAWEGLTAILMLACMGMISHYDSHLAPKAFIAEE